MRPMIPVLIFLLTGAAAQAEERAVCKVTAKFPGTSLEEKIVSVELQPDYRYFKGRAEFQLSNGSVPGSIEILTWGGRGGQVHQNTISVGPITMSGVGLNASLMSDGSLVKMSCELM